MSTDKSLKSKGALTRHRNVLGRDERIEILKEAGKWEEGKSVFALPKVRALRARRRGKAKATPKAGAEGAAATPEKAAE
jgi:small basic protein (TIGR04137 family)